jgi:hypothetical protein
MGVAWAIIGYAVASLLQRGQLATTVITAVAGALGMGAGVLKESHASLGALPGVVVGLEVAAVAALAVLAWRLAGGAARRRHGSAAIAYTRHVLYEDPVEPRKPARIRLKGGPGRLL